MAEGPVESWLGNIENMMFKTLYDLTKIALKAYPENELERNEWFFEHPAQCILSVDQIKWTYNTTKIILKNGENPAIQTDDYQKFIDFSN